MKNKEKDMVSIIIPTHNRGNLLGNAIQSVINQTYKEIEIIVVDDASTCDNHKVIESFEFPIIYYRFETNQGGNVCRNKGVELSTGKYVAFLDDDDIWHSDKLEKQLASMTKHNIDLSYTGKNMIVVDESLNEKKRWYAFSEPRYDSLKKSIMLMNFIGTTSSIVVEKEKFLAVGGFDIKMPALQDYEFCIRFIYKGFNVKGINEGLVDYFIYKKQKAVSKNPKKKLKAIYKLTSKNKNRKYFFYFFYFIVKYIVKTIYNIRA